jgi:hypothetical protein
MAQHGYLGDGYGAHGEIDPDRNDDRNREHDRRERGDYRGRDWDERRLSDRDRGFMFEGRDRDRSRFGPERGAFGGSSDWEERGGYSASPDAHYRSWRDRHMAELDRDYEDYCREREHQFHRDFDEWRRNREQSHSPDSELVLRAESMESGEALNGPNPMSDATLGANNSETETTGRTRR